MALAIRTPIVPLSQDSSGNIRIGNTRVTLDSVVTAFRNGSTAEQLAHEFPVLQLDEIYATIAYYLQHRTEIDNYLSDQAIESQTTRESIERDQATQRMRKRLLELRRQE